MPTNHSSACRLTTISSAPIPDQRIPPPESRDTPLRHPAVAIEPREVRTRAREGSHVGWVFDHGRPRQCRDLETERELAVEEELYRSGVRSYLCAPLTGSGKPIGTLNIASPEPDRFSHDDTTFFQKVARQVVLAVENMQAY